MRKLIAMVFIMLGILPSYSQWNDNTQTFTSSKYNIKWELADFGDWRIATKSQMPKDMIFCGALQDDAITASLICIDDNKPVEDAWQNSDEFINALILNLIKNFITFPGIQNGDVKYENGYFLYKKAIKFGVPITINDMRLSKDKPIPFLYCGYAFAKGNSIIMPTVLIPMTYVEQYGDTVVDMFFTKLSYVDIIKER